MSDVDTVVIGSGAGGLTAAVALARAGQRVLVLEQHELPGGWCHSFDLDGHTFSPGVHYVGDLGPGGRLRAIYEGLGVAADLLFLELNPEGFDHVRIGSDFRFDIPKGRERYADRLAQRFPHEADGIRRFLALMEAIAGELSTLSSVRGPLGALALPARCPNLVRYGLRPLARVLDGFVRDPYARAVLTVQGGDHGMPPSRCPTVLHAAVVAHYFDGGWYPKGGARSLPKAFLKELRRHGGRIEVRAPVERILVEGGRAIGVRLRDGREIRARQVVSNADPHATFGLLPEEVVPRRLARRLRRTRYSISAVSLFLAAELDARAAGLDSGNVWSLRTPDVEESYRYAADPDPLSRGPVPGSFLTCTTLKDPSKHKRGVHTFEAFAFVSWEAFARFAGSGHGDRPEGYLRLKEALADRVLEQVQTVVPGLRERLVFQDVGTPLTNRHYVAATRGSLYGTEKTLGALGPLGFPVRAPVQGLFLCGASTTSHGVAGATMSGLAAARALLGVRTSELLTARDQELRTWPAEAPERWPRAEAAGA